MEAARGDERHNIKVAMVDGEKIDLKIHLFNSHTSRLYLYIPQFLNMQSCLQSAGICRGTRTL